MVNHHRKAPHRVFQGKARLSPCEDSGLAGGQRPSVVFSEARGLSDGSLRVMGATSKQVPRVEVG